jgi:hypothetical protein
MKHPRLNVGFQSTTVSFYLYEITTCSKVGGSG